MCHLIPELNRNTSCHTYAIHKGGLAGALVTDWAATPIKGFANCCFYIPSITSILCTHVSGDKTNSILVCSWWGYEVTWHRQTEQSTEHVHTFNVPQVKLPLPVSYDHPTNRALLKLQRLVSTILQVRMFSYPTHLCTTAFDLPVERVFNTLRTSFDLPVESVFNTLSTSFDLPVESVYINLGHGLMYAFEVLLLITWDIVWSINWKCS